MLDLRDNFQSFMKKTSISTNTNLSQESQYSVEKHKPWCPLRSEVMGMWENLETIIRSHHPASEVGPHEQDKIQILLQSHRVYGACVHVAPPHLAGSQPQRPPQSRTFCDRLNLTPPRSLCRHSSSLWSVNWLYYNFYPLECFPSENTFFVSRLPGLFGDFLLLWSVLLNLWAPQDKGPQLYYSNHCGPQKASEVSGSTVNDGSID